MLPDHLGSLFKKLRSRPCMHVEAGPAHGIFLKYPVIKQKIRAVETDVVQSPVGADDVLDRLGQLLVHAAAKTVVCVSSRHIRSNLHPVL